MSEHATPAGLGEAGARLWAELVAGTEFRPDELTIVEMACHTVDTIDRLRGGDPSPKTDTEIRLQEDHLRKLLNYVSWPQDGDAASHAGSELALHRHRTGR